MAKKKKSGNKFGISPSTIFLNLTIVMAVCIICFLTYNMINGDLESTTSEPPFTPVTSAPPETTPAPQSESSVPQQSTTPAQSTVPSVIIDVNSSGEETSAADNSDVSQDDNSEAVTETTAPATTGPELSQFYTPEFFDTALFVGDSITTGLSLYGFINDDNVFAQQGMAPSTALDATINGITLSDAVVKVKPERIYIMLGTNSVGYADASYLVGCMDEFLKSVTSLSKAKVYVLSIPPVTKAAELSDENCLSKAAVEEYNTLLKPVVESNNAVFIDFHALLCDSEGYFREEYAEADGIHFMGDTYKVMLSMLEEKTS